MATKKSKAWMDDHDDAHFDGNPAYRKRHAKKRVGSSGRTARFTGKGKTKKRTTRKRVAGK
jgi:hypothetical protein